MFWLHTSPGVCCSWTLFNSVSEHVQTLIKLSLKQNRFQLLQCTFKNESKRWDSQQPPKMPEDYGLYFLPRPCTKAYTTIGSDGEFLCSADTWDSFPTVIAGFFHERQGSAETLTLCLEVAVAQSTAGGSCCVAEEGRACCRPRENESCFCSLGQNSTFPMLSFLAIQQKVSW